MPIITSIGFTGTRFGMNDLQKEQLHSFLKNIIHPVKRLQFHHGDCIGSDAEADGIARLYEFEMHIHIPLDTSKCAFRFRATAGDVMYDALPYLKRNKKIVEMCDLLIVAPGSNTEQLISGTWSTKRYAEKINVPFKILQRN